MDIQSIQTYSSTAPGYPAVEPQQQQHYPPMVGYAGQNFPIQQQQYPNHLNQPFIPAGYYQQPVAPSTDQLMNDPLYQLEKSLRCARTAIMVLSFITYILFVVAIVHPIIYHYSAAYFPLVMLPHLLLALVAHTTIHKPLKQQLMNGSGSNCSLFILALFSLVLIIAIVVIIWMLQEFKHCENSACGFLHLVFIYVGVIPASIFFLLWFLPCAYFAYKLKIEKARRNPNLMQRVMAQNQ